MATKLNDTTTTVMAKNNTMDEIVLFSGLEMIKEFSVRSEEHTSELQSQSNLVCRLLLEKKKSDVRTVSQLLTPQKRYSLSLVLQYVWLCLSRLSAGDSTSYGRRLSDTSSALALSIHPLA